MSNFWDELLGDDEHAASYMETYGEGIGAETRTILAKFIDDGQTLIDIGCGPGWNYDHFKEFGPALLEYRGHDYSERFVRVANERAFAKYDEKPFELGDVRKIKARDKSWDVVLMQDVLEHTNGYEQPIQEALRVARDKVIVTFWHLTENDDHINDDGNDGWGAWYSQPKWEEFLNTLPYEWHHTEFEFPVGRKRDLYVIEKDESWLAA